MSSKGVILLILDQLDLLLLSTGDTTFNITNYIGSENFEYLLYNDDWNICTEFFNFLLIIQSFDFLFFQVQYIYSSHL